jgi:hypothetical protein
MLFMHKKFNKFGSCFLKPAAQQQTANNLACHGPGHGMLERKEPMAHKNKDKSRVTLN